MQVTVEEDFTIIRDSELKKLKDELKEADKEIRSLQERMEFQKNEKEYWHKKANDWFDEKEKYRKDVAYLKRQRENDRKAITRLTERNEELARANSEMLTEIEVLKVQKYMPLKQIRHLAPGEVGFCHPSAIVRNRNGEAKDVDHDYGVTPEKYMANTTKIRRSENGLTFVIEEEI